MVESTTIIAENYYGKLVLQYVQVNCMLLTTNLFAMIMNPIHGWYFAKWHGQILAAGMMTLRNGAGCTFARQIFHNLAFSIFFLQNWQCEINLRFQINPISWQNHVYQNIICGHEFEIGWVGVSTLSEFFTKTMAIYLFLRHLWQK